ncbi:hypothetical protein SPRG_13688 [Saprolegnia parasitica CBS 223.65]|uniref:SAC domain-containing protein n=1 Tax=Saprolegnia parasitica (strain CBS 223.65) TaxID=695850 RepID=A0A067BX02_SAPPC|nr:hypothetical protein SPRG_13688 [Saprolegnia parasitica CBS 223.65]KDO21375.1 hypothetical protein SPRG_13688 [Saprolegnia parasitica CBS 223.65]|eukprot:XP_012207931.1 hypothetical protein SPRG_13688 [Saprolegnia parasitica CBS 223.65]
MTTDVSGKAISGWLFRRTTTGFFNMKGTGDWGRVWCEFEYATGVFSVYLDGQKHRRLLSWKVLQCSIQHVRNDGRYCIELEFVQQKKKETLSSAPESHDIEWWFDVLTTSKLALAEGRVPNARLLVRTPPTTLPVKIAPEYEKRGKARTPAKPALRRRQPRLTTNLSRFERITVYETQTHFYVVGSDRTYSRFRLFSLDRLEDAPSSLDAIFKEDPTVYSWEEMEALLQGLDTEARAATKYGLVRAFSAVAIVGFIKFLQGYYLIVVTQRRKIGCIGGHFIYAIQATQCLPIRRPKSDGSSWTWVSRWLNPSPIEDAEARYLGLFHFVDLTKDFYYSYTYDLTHTLQHNMTTDQTKSLDMFEWNHHLNKEFTAALSSPASAEWVQPLLLGFYEQRKCSLFGRLISVIVLARRSRHFAGTRYLKRGIADTGKVANDVETEQIIEDENTHGKFSAFVHVTIPKPPIQLNRIDPSYAATQAHFVDLFERYGSPTLVLNLVKQHEKVQREMIVGTGFKSAVEYINTFIPHEHKLRYVALDYSRLSKMRVEQGSRVEAVRQALDKVGTWALDQTGFFCSAPKRHLGSGANKRTARRASPARPPSSYGPAPPVSSGTERPSSPTIPRDSGDWLEQHGVLRTNCIDCLDRTNVAQFSVAMRALGQQLYAMGIRNTPHLETSSPILAELTRMFGRMGDIISMQYGGSEANKKVAPSKDTIKHWELLTSIRRYYSNAFTDMAKQDAINLFLGNFVPRASEPPLWELESDYYLHNFQVERPLALPDMGPFHRIHNLVALKRSHGPSSKAEYLRLRASLLNETWWKSAVEAFDAPKFFTDKLLLPSPAHGDGKPLLMRKSSATSSAVLEDSTLSEKSLLWMQTQDKEEFFSFDAALASSFMLPIAMKEHDPHTFSTPPPPPSSSSVQIGSNSLTRQVRSMSAPEETLQDVSSGSSLKRSLSNMRLQELLRKESGNTLDDAKAALLLPPMLDAPPLDIEEYAASRGLKRVYVGAAMGASSSDPIYDRYVESGESLSFWEKEAKNVKSDFILYLRDASIDVDDVGAVFEAAVRGGCTYKIQSGVYAGLEQHVKARGLLSKKFFKNEKDRQFICNALDDAQLCEMHPAPPSDMELYASFFDEVASTPLLPRLTVGDQSIASSGFELDATLEAEKLKAGSVVEEFIDCNAVADDVRKSMATLVFVKK